MIPVVDRWPRASLAVVSVLFVAAMFVADAKAQASSGNPPPLDAVGLDALAWCESDRDYGVVDGLGLFDGAYQFLQSTWNWAAEDSGNGHWSGYSPAYVPPIVQDEVAAWLWVNADPAEQWPRCYDDALRAMGFTGVPCVGPRNVIECTPGEIGAEGNPVRLVAPVPEFAG